MGFHPVVQFAFLFSDRFGDGLYILYASRQVPDILIVFRVVVDACQHLE